MLKTLTWSRVFTIAKKVARVATLTVNIRVLVKTNWWSIGVLDLRERIYRKGTYCYSREENALNLGVINGFAEAWNSFQCAFLNLKNILLCKKRLWSAEVHTIACSDSKALYTKGRTSAKIYVSIIWRKRNGWPTFSEYTLVSLVLQHCKVVQQCQHILRRLSYDEKRFKTR